jgi:hypothetical protein
MTEPAPRPDPADRREFTRVALRLDVRFKTDAGAELRGVATDIACNGLFIQGQPPPQGSAGECLIGFNELLLWCRCVVTRCTVRGFAVRITGIDLDSYHHLQRLLLLNSANPATVQREFDEHLGLLRFH